MEYKHLYVYASLRTGQKKNELIANLMSQFEEWVQTGKEPTEFYKTYDFEQFLFNS